jgi:enterochelin esterase family protein
LEDHATALAEDSPIQQNLGHLGGLPGARGGLENEAVALAEGKDDFLVETSRKTVGMFREHGFDVVYRETDGAHTWDKWREYLNEFTPLLFR